MKMLKKMLCVVCAVLMLCGLVGCSTPEDALTVDGKTYSTGEYLAYLLETFQQVYYNGGLYYYEQQGMDIWTQTFTYNDKQLALGEYIKALTVDTIVRQKALENMMAEAGVQPSEETTESTQEMLDGIEESTLLSFGVSKENYTKMAMAYYRNEMSLFLSRYDKDGTTPVAEEDIRKFFDDNYLSFKMISVEMMKDEKEMSADEQKAVTEELQKYLNLYNSGTDFNEVIAQYNYNTSTATSKEKELLTDKDTRQDVDASTYSDTALTDAIKKIPEGEAQLVTYKAGGEKLTAAIILRLDPEQGEGYENAFVDSRQSILLSIKHEEFNKDVEKVADALAYEMNQRVYKMCDPKDFLG